MAYPPTFKDIQEAVIDKLRLDPDLDRQRVKDWINQAYMEACMETEFFLTAVVSSSLPRDTGSVGVPAPIDRGSINYIVSTQADGTIYGPMDLVPLDQVLEQRSWGGATQTQGAPQLYAYISGPQPTIEFWPGASGGEVLTFYGTRLPAVLDTDGDVCQIPEPYGSNILEFGADAQAAEYKQNYIMLPTFQQEAEMWLSRFRGFQNNRSGNQPQQLPIFKSRVPVPSSNSVDTGR